jgi:hypothetical protein
MWTRNEKFLQGGLQHNRLKVSHDLGPPSGMAGQRAPFLYF